VSTYGYTMDSELSDMESFARSPQSEMSRQNFRSFFEIKPHTVGLLGYYNQQLSLHTKSNII